MLAVANATSSADARPFFSAVVTTPTPSGGQQQYVAGDAPCLRLTTAGSMMPVTASPYLGSFVVDSVTAGNDCTCFGNFVRAAAQDFAQQVEALIVGNAARLTANSTWPPIA